MAKQRKRKPPKLCTVDGCDGISKARGWCPKHYARWQAHGDIHTVLSTNGTGQPVDLRSRQKRQAGLTSGMTLVGGELAGASRVMRPRHEGPIPRDLIKPYPQLLWADTKRTRLKEVGRLLGHLEWWERKYRGVLRDNGDDWAAVLKHEGEWTRGSYADGHLDDHTITLQIIHRLHALSHPDIDRLEGTWLRTVRESFDMKTDQLAEVVGVHTPSVSRWETGVRNIAREHHSTVRNTMQEIWLEQQRAQTWQLLVRHASIEGALTTDIDREWAEMQAWIVDKVRTTPEGEDVFDILCDARIGIPKGPWHESPEGPIEDLFDRWYWSPLDVAYWGVYATSVYRR